MNSKTTLVLVLLLIAVGSEASGGSAKKATPPDEPLPPPPAPPNTKKVHQDPACDADEAYVYDYGDPDPTVGPELRMPTEAALALYDFTPAEKAKVMTVLTRVINGNYNRNFPGGDALCNRTKVAKAAKVKCTQHSALAMLTYWELRQDDAPRPHPNVDPAMAGVTMMDTRDTAKAQVHRFNTFFKFAARPQEA